MASRRQELLEFEANDFYAYLNLEVGAGEAEVKRHFRQLALVWHPDKHPEGADRQRATDIFQQVNKAHEVLSDKQQRCRYDPVWYQKHQGRHRVVPEWALKAGGGRAGSVEGRPGSVARTGSIDRCASVGPDPFERKCPPATSSSAAPPGRRFGPMNFAEPFPMPPRRASSRPPREDTFEEARGSSESHGGSAPSRPRDSGQARKPVGESLRESRRAAAAAEMQREQEKREAEFLTRDREAKRREEDLKKREKERAAAQAEWFKKKRAEAQEVPRPPPPKRSPEPQDDDCQDYGRTRAPTTDDLERNLIEELRLKMSKQAEELAAQARAAAEASVAVKARVSEAASASAAGRHFAFVPEARPFSQLSESSVLAKKEPEGLAKPSDQASSWQPWEAATGAASGAAAATEAAANRAAFFAEEVSSGLSSLFGTLMTPSSWVGSRPIREEAKPVPDNCPRCGKSMPKVTGANFCQHCHHIVT